MNLRNQLNKNIKENVNSKMHYFDYYNNYKENQ